MASVAEEAWLRRQQGDVDGTDLEYSLASGSGACSPMTQSVCLIAYSKVRVPTTVCQGVKRARARFSRRRNGIGGPRASPFASLAIQNSKTRNT